MQFGCSDGTHLDKAQTMNHQNKKERLDSGQK